MSSFIAVVMPGAARRALAAHEVPRIGEGVTLPDSGQIYRVTDVVHPTINESDRPKGIHLPEVWIR